jgi:hypothetical protein
LATKPVDDAAKDAEFFVAEFGDDGEAVAEDVLGGVERAAGAGFDEQVVGGHVEDLGGLGDGLG